AARFGLQFPVWDPATATDRARTESPAELVARLAAAAAAESARARGASAGRVSALPPPTEQAGSPAGERRTVLAVDDESTVLALTKDSLEMHGYRGLTARN